MGRGPWHRAPCLQETPASPPPLLSSCSLPPPAPLTCWVLKYRRVSNTCPLTWEDRGPSSLEGDPAKCLSKPINTQAHQHHFPLHSRVYRPVWDPVWGFPDDSVGKESSCSAGDPGSIPGSGRSAGEGIGYPLQYSWASLVAQLVKNLPAVWETWARSLSWEDLLEKGRATHYSILGLPLWLSW